MYTYSYANITAINLPQLEKEINSASGLNGKQINYSNYTASTHVLDLYFESELTSAEQTALATVVSNHTPVDDGFSTFIRSIMFYPPYDANYGDYRVQIMSSTGVQRMTFKVPYDFDSLSHLYIWYTPVNNIPANKTVTVSSDYCAIGEVYNYNSESANNISITGDANIMAKIDVAEVFSSLEAGDICGLTLELNTIGTSIRLYLIELEYVKR